MRIAFTGSRVKRRLVGEYEWSRETGFVQEVVDPGLAMELLTSPRDDFAVADDDPLCGLEGVDPDRAAELVLAGVGGLDDLAGLSGAWVDVLAQNTGASKDQVKEWVKEARLALGESQRADQSTEEVGADE